MEVLNTTKYSRPPTETLKAISIKNLGYQIKALNVFQASFYCISNLTNPNPSTQLYCTSNTSKTSYIKQASQFEKLSKMLPRAFPYEKLKKKPQNEATFSKLLIKAISLLKHLIEKAKANCKFPQH